MSYPKIPFFVQHSRTKTSPLKTGIEIPRKRQQVRSILISRLKARFASPKQQEMDSFIQQEVDDLMERDNVCMSHLKSAEQRLCKFSKSVERLAHKKSSTQKTHLEKNETLALDPNYSCLDPKIPPLEESKELSHLPSIVRSNYFSPTKSHWAKVIELDLQKLEKEKNNKEQEKREKHLKLREDLDKQLLERKNLLEKDRQENLKYVHLLNSKVELDKDKERQRIREKQQKLFQQKLVQDQQLKEKYLRMQKEGKEQKNNEKAQLNELHLELQKEKLQEREKREKRLQQAKKVLQENEEAKKKREEEQRKILEEEMKEIERYNEKQKEKELQMAEERKARETRAKAFFQYTADTVGKRQGEKLREENERLLKDFEEREKKEKEKNEISRMLQKEKEKDVRIFLDQQVQHKKEKRQEEKQQTRDLVNRWNQESDKIAKEERIKALLKRKKNIEVKEYQLHQIAERKSIASRSADMSELELKINKVILEEDNESS